MFSNVLTHCRLTYICIIDVRLGTRWDIVVQDVMRLGHQQHPAIVLRVMK